MNLLDHGCDRILSRCQRVSEAKPLLLIAFVLAISKRAIALQNHHDSRAIASCSLGWQPFYRLCALIFSISLFSIRLIVGGFISRVFS